MNFCEANASDAHRLRRTKAELEKNCRCRFRVTVDIFEYCWREANRVTGARWNRPGAPHFKIFPLNPLS